MFDGGMFERWGFLTQGTQRSGAEFRRVASGGYSSGGDFNAMYAAFRRRVSRGFEQWVFFAGLSCACGLDGLCHFFKMQT